MYLDIHAIFFSAAICICSAGYIPDSGQQYAPTYQDNQQLQQNIKQPQYTDPICEPDCKNNGICVDTNTCHCLVNFRGKYCELEKKPCLAYPPPPKNSMRKCNDELCTVTCAKGHKFSDGTTVADVRCVDGQWRPTRADLTSIPDCEPECNPPCLNGGACLAVNTCQCPAEYRGPQCQYSASVCDHHKLAFNGSYKCNGNNEGVSCRLSCPPGTAPSAAFADQYSCLFSTGIFAPQPIPHCVFSPKCEPGCKNNGICVDTNTCHCPTNFYGTYCEFEKKPCLTYPPLPKNSIRKCNDELCTVTCVKGHKFSDSTTVADMRCVDGQWRPTRADLTSIPDCEPECNPPCLNGGACLAVNTCQCPAEYRGPQCQYSASVCDHHKLAFNGSYKCNENGEGVSCRLSCLPGTAPSAAFADQYSCLFSTGTFAPQPILHCVFSPKCEPGCKNNGICVDTNTCHCPTKFYGTYCEFEKKPCLTYPPLPKNSIRKCNDELCTVTCAKGHKFSDGTTVADMRCVDGQWRPTRAHLTSIPDCEPECNPPCLNGGACLAVNTCQCPAEYRGPQCQYSASVCDHHKLAFNGSYKCNENGEGVSCRLSCLPGTAPSAAFADQYSCLFSTGNFAPQPIPHCVFSPKCEPGCKNNGICVDTNTCHCPTKFYGTYCEFEKKPCLTYPPLPKNSIRKCNDELCTVTCAKGHKFSDGTTVADMRCVDGQWRPTRADLTSIPDCEPECNPPCLNAGACLAVNTCQCPAEYRGPQCQYSSSSCDSHKLAFNGSYKCNGNDEGVACHLSCPPDASPSAAFADQYKCLYSTGKFTPQPIPQCVFRPKCQPGCKNNGVCIGTNTCRCPANFQGRLCESKKPQVKPGPKCQPGCKNNGVCIGTNTCRCPANFQGRICESKKPQVKPGPKCQPGCKNHGVCIGTNKCRCPANFQGRLCGIKVQHTKPAPICWPGCKNNGVCIGWNMCRCPANFHGRFCEFHKKPCIGKHLINHLHQKFQRFQNHIHQKPIFNLWRHH